MKEKLNEHLRKDETILWHGCPSLKMLDDAHKNIYLGKAVLVVFAAVAFLMYYMLGVQAGTIQFKGMVIVLLAVLAGVPLVLDWMDADKLNKAMYAVTDQRLIVYVNGAAHSVDFDRIDTYKFDTDKAGQTSLLCGKSGVKSPATRRRLHTIFDCRMSNDGTVCDRFVMYGIPDADAVAKLMKRYVK